MKDIINEIKELQREVDKAKIGLAQAEGSLSSIEEDLMEKFGLKPDQVEKELDKLQEEKDELESEIKQRWDKLKEEYDW